MINQSAQPNNSLSFLLSTPVLIAVSLLSIIGLGFFTPLFDLDEGAFSEATREMLASGNWVSTYLNGEPRHDKPILIYWLQAISATLFGINSFAFRLPSVIAALGWIYIVYRFVREFFSAKAASIVVWVMACTPLVSVIGKAATADALLNLLLTASYFQIFRFWHFQNQQQTDSVYRRSTIVPLALLGLLFGLGFLTKGPVAVALPVATALVAFSIKGQFMLWLKACTHPVSLLVFITVILPWHIAVYLDQGFEFFEGFYLGHNLGRFSSTMENHGGSPLYYIIALPFLLLPFSRQFFASLARIKSNLNRNIAPFTLFGSVWFLITLVLFSFSQTQLPHYLLYGLVPLFILMAVRLAEHNHCHRLWDTAIPATALILFAWAPLALTTMINEPRDYDSATALAGWQAFVGGYWLVALGLSTIALAACFSSMLDRTSRSLVVGFLAICACNFVFLPTLSAGQQQPVYYLASVINEQYPSANVVSYKTNMPSFSVYAKRIVTRSEPSVGDVVFLKIDKIDQLMNSTPNAEYIAIANSAGLALYQRAK